MPNAAMETCARRRVLAHYEEQTQEEAVAEDKSAFEGQKATVIEVPKELVPAVRQLIAKYEGNKKAPA